MNDENNARTAEQFEAELKKYIEDFIININGLNHNSKTRFLIKLVVMAKSGFYQESKN